MMIESQEMDDVAEKERAILSAGGSSGVQGPRKLQLQIAGEGILNACQKGEENCMQKPRPSSFFRGDE